MLKRLSIKNFQSHESTDLDFSTGVNVLVGSSDSGKSAALRALCWLATNRPRGTNFIRHGSDGDCQVDLETDTGVISRLRSKTSNAYMLDGESLEAMGAEVPKPIADLLNLADINMSGQFDGHFLLADSPGAIAKAVNDAAHLEEAETCAANLASQHKVALAEVKTLQARQAVINSDLRHFDSLPGYRVALEAAIALDGSLERIRTVLAGLNVVMFDIRDSTAAIAALGEPMDWQGACAKAESLVAKKDVDYQRLDQLEAVMQRLDQTDEELSALPEIDGVLLEAATALDGERRMLRARMDALDILLNNIDDAGCRINLADRDGRAAEAAYNEGLAELTICPTCGQDLDEKAKKTVLENAR